MADWRLQGQEKYLQGALLFRQAYRRFREDWDHDHCEFCGQKFSERSGDLNVGYATRDCYRWICEDCFRDFRERFQWTASEGADARGTLGEVKQDADERH